MILLVMSVGFPVSANNHSDTSFEFSLPDWQYVTIYTPGRYKSDTSSSYVYFYDTTDYWLQAYGVHFSIWGGESSQTWIENCTSPGGYGAPIIYPDQKRLIRQNVCEWGYDYAFIAASAPTPGAAGACPAGLWSPDSVGSYPYAN